MDSSLNPIDTPGFSGQLNNQSPPDPINRNVDHPLCSPSIPPSIPNNARTRHYNPHQFTDQNLSSSSHNHHQNHQKYGNISATPEDQAGLPIHPPPFVFFGPRHPTIFYPKKLMFPSPGEVPLRFPPGVLLPAPQTSRVHNSRLPEHSQHQQPTDFHKSYRTRYQHPIPSHNYPRHQHPTPRNQRPEHLFQTPHQRNLQATHQHRLQASPHHLNKSQYYQYSQDKMRSMDGGASGHYFKHPKQIVRQEELGAKCVAPVASNSDVSSCSPVSVIRKICPPPGINFPSTSKNLRQTGFVDVNENTMENNDSELSRSKNGEQFHLIKTGQELARMCFAVEVGCQTDLSFPLDKEIVVMPVEALSDIITEVEDEKNKNKQDENVVTSQTEEALQPDIMRGSFKGGVGTEIVATLDVKDETVNTGEDEGISQESLFDPDCLNEFPEYPESTHADDTEEIDHSIPEDLNNITDEAVENNNSNLSLEMSLIKGCDDQMPQEEKIKIQSSQSPNSDLKVSKSQNEHTSPEKLQTRENDKNNEIEDSNGINIDLNFAINASKICHKNPIKDVSDLKSKLQDSLQLNELCNDSVSLNNDCEANRKSFNPLANFTTLMSYTDPLMGTVWSEMLYEDPTPSGLEFPKQNDQLAESFNERSFQSVQETNDVCENTKNKYPENVSVTRIETKKEVKDILTKSSNSIICRNPGFIKATSQKINSTEMCDKLMKNRRISECSVITDGLLGENEDQQRSTSKQQCRSGFRPQENFKQKTPRQKYRENGIGGDKKPDIATRMSSEQHIKLGTIPTNQKPSTFCEDISQNWNISFLHALNTTEKCGSVSGITSLKKDELQHKPLQKMLNKEAEQYTTPNNSNEYSDKELSGKSLEKRSSRGRLLKKKRFDDYEESTAESNSDEYNYHDDSEDESSNENLKDFFGNTIEKHTGEKLDKSIGPIVSSNNKTISNKNTKENNISIEIKDTANIINANIPINSSDVHNLSAESLVIKIVSEGKFESNAKDIGETKLLKIDASNTELEMKTSDSLELQGSSNKMNETSNKNETNLEVNMDNSNTNSPFKGRSDGIVNRKMGIMNKKVDIMKAKEKCEGGDRILRSASKANLIFMKDEKIQENKGEIIEQRKKKSFLNEKLLNQVKKEGNKKTSQLTKLLQKIFEEVLEDPASDEFYYNLNEAHPMPRYCVINDLEIDLKSVEMKLDHDLYTNTEHFLEDFRNIAKKSVDYFGPVHNISKKSGKLLDLVCGLVSRLDLNLPSCPKIDLMETVNYENNNQGVAKHPSRGKKRNIMEAAGNASKKSRDESPDYSCEECGTIFVLLRSYKQHCKTKAGCVKSPNKGNRLISHQTENDDSFQSGLSNVTAGNDEHSPVERVEQSSENKRKNEEKFNCLECHLQFSSEEAMNNHIELDWPGCAELFSKDTSRGENNKDATGCSHDVSPKHPAPPIVTSSMKPLSKRKGRPKKSVIHPSAVRGVAISHPQDNIVIDADDDNFEPPGLLVRSPLDVIANNM